jgi:GntR family transcriptional regulator/MocR family aminotransferase
MKETLKTVFKDMIEIISEGGGLAIIIRPTINIDLQKLRANALKEGVKIYLGSDDYGEA